MKRLAVLQALVAAVLGCGSPPRAPLPKDGTVAEPKEVRAPVEPRAMPTGPVGTPLVQPMTLEYTFRVAPTDWRVAGGTWKIAPRWQDDPRGTFFCGGTEPGAAKRAAVLWHKRSFPGDVSVDVLVGPKMEPRRGNRYEYVRDVNVTLCADGRDLVTGYTFTFGGFGNTRSAILRGNEVLAESVAEGATLPVGMVTGRRWWRIHAERTGHDLRFFSVAPHSYAQVDDARAGQPSHARTYDKEPMVLASTDPDPLPGDRLAIWTYDCGIVLLRVEITGQAGAMESPDFVAPGVPRTYLDMAGDSGGQTE